MDYEDYEDYEGMAVGDIYKQEMRVDWIILRNTRFQSPVGNKGIPGISKESKLKKKNSLKVSWKCWDLTLALERGS